MADLDVDRAMATPAAGGHSRATGRSRATATSPLGWRDLGTALVALAIVIALGSLAGKALVVWSAPNAVTDYDVRLAQDLAADRTTQLDQLASDGALLSSTMVKIVVTAVVAVVMALVWRRWHEPVYVIGTLLFEATAFIAITTIVQRARPPVDRLEASPVDSSFPSGHVAAATVYAVLAIVVFWHTRSLLARAAAVAVAVALPLIVGAARMYQGMHHLSDVVAGVILGLVSIAICHSILGAPHDAHPLTGRRAAPPPSGRPDRAPAGPPGTTWPADRREVAP